MSENYFPDDFIGQETLKRSVSFKLAAYHSTGIFRPALITGSRGMGKTRLAHIIANNLTDEHGMMKPAFEIGAQSIKGLDDFIDTVIIPYCSGDSKSTIFLDEVHLLHPRIMGFLLQALNTTDSGETSAQHNGQTYIFSLKKVSWIMATTNKEKLVKPLIDRCINQFEMATYTISELGKILLKQCSHIQFTDDKLVDKIASFGRNNPRVLFSIGEHLKDYCQINQNNSITESDWNSIKSHIGMQPFNLANSEVITLHILNNEGPSKLSHLASKLELDPTTVRRAVEPFLLSNGLIKIDIKREITRLGREVLSSCDLTHIKSKAIIKSL